jgi:hypothetical protein
VRRSRLSTAGRERAGASWASPIAPTSAHNAHRVDGHVTVAAECFGYSTTALFHDTYARMLSEFDEDAALTMGRDWAGLRT